MVIAHLPAGYILSRAFKASWLAPAVMIGSLMPDIDLIYFYTIGQRAVIHHEYPTHMPVFWLCLALAAWPILAITAPRLVAIIPAFIGGVLLHLALDSITGSVHWLTPFSDHTTTLVKVTARYEPWLLNFIIHWTFVLEIAVCAVAGLVFRKAPQASSPEHGVGQQQGDVGED